MWIPTEGYFQAIVGQARNTKYPHSRDRPRWASAEGMDPTRRRDRMPISILTVNLKIITRCHTSSSTTKQADRESLPHAGCLMVSLLRNIGLQERQKRVCLRRSRSKLIGPSGTGRTSRNRFGRVVCGKF